MLRLGWGGEKGMVYFYVGQPIADKQCRGYCIIGRNYDLEQPDTVLQDFEDIIFSQDQRIVESQRPEQVPFDLADELHLKFDAVAVNYRRAMQQQGLDYYRYLYRRVTEAGVNICVGVDSHCGGDAFEELRAVELDERSRREQRIVAATAPALLTMGTEAGYAAIGMADGWREDAVHCAPTIPRWSAQASRCWPIT